MRFGAPAAGLALIALVFWFSHGISGPSSGSLGQFYSVAPMDLDVKINKDGELAALNNIDIICEVEGQTTIQTIVPEGSNVKKGDVLLVIDPRWAKADLNRRQAEFAQAGFQRCPHPLLVLGMQNRKECFYRIIAQHPGSVGGNGEREGRPRTCSAKGSSPRRM